MLHEEMKERTCADCGELLECEEYYNCDGEPICEYCMDNYYICDDCGDTVFFDSVCSVDDGDRCVCYRCLRQSYNKCDDCGEYFSETVYDGYITLCYDCYENYYNRCVDCYCIVHEDRTYYRHGEAYCESCYCQYRYGHIHRYDYRPCDFTLYGDDGRTTLFYGVELEIDGGDDFNICEDLDQIEEIYLKEDGSLSCGFEIVTHPATLEYHINNLPWANICSIAEKGGYKSHDTTTCGLHIHASRAGFGRTTIEQDLTIAKLMLVFDRFWDDKIVPFSRRNYENLHRWAKKPNSNITDKDTVDDAVEKVQNCKDDRYQAINLTNRHTVEFRIFRGTLKYTTILASIQWVDTLIKFCRNTPLKDFARVTWEEIFANTKHAELKAYLKQRNLLKKDVI